MNTWKLILGIVGIVAAIAAYMLLSSPTVKYIVAAILAIVGIVLLVMAFRGGSSGMEMATMQAPAAKPAAMPQQK